MGETFSDNMVLTLLRNVLGNCRLCRLDLPVAVHDLGAAASESESMIGDRMKEN
jgi:hypothetical protein